jgi:hypothetical protein
MNQLQRILLIQKCLHSMIWLIYNHSPVFTFDIWDNKRKWVGRTRKRGVIKKRGERGSTKNRIHHLQE